MATHTEYVDYARECVQLAGLVTDQGLRDQLLDMACQWMAEAMRKQPKRVEVSH